MSELVMDIMMLLINITMWNPCWDHILSLHGLHELWHDYENDTNAQGCHIFCNSSEFNYLDEFSALTVPCFSCPSVLLSSTVPDSVIQAMGPLRLLESCSSIMDVSNISKRLSLAVFIYVWRSLFFLSHGEAHRFHNNCKLATHLSNERRTESFQDSVQLPSMVSGTYQWQIYIPLEFSCGFRLDRFATSMTRGLASVSLASNGSILESLTALMEWNTTAYEMRKTEGQSDTKSF